MRRARSFSGSAANNGFPATVFAALAHHSSVKTSEEIFLESRTVTLATLCTLVRSRTLRRKQEFETKRVVDLDHGFFFSEHDSRRI